MSIRHATIKHNLSLNRKAQAKLGPSLVNSVHLEPEKEKTGQHLLCLMLTTTLYNAFNNNGRC